MAKKTFEELKQMAIQIRDEKANKQNTATRIGTQMVEHLNKLEQEYYNKENIDEQKEQTDAKFSELEKKGAIIFEEEKENSMSFTMYLDSENKTGDVNWGGRYILVKVESQYQQGFYLYQRNGSANVKEEGLCFTNQYYLIKIVDNTVNRLFTYASSAEGKVSAKMILLSDADEAILNMSSSNNNDVLINEGSIPNNNGTINHSLLLNHDVKRDDYIKLRLSSSNISDNATVDLRQRNGSSDISIFGTINFNKDYFVEIADDSVDRLYVSLAKNVNTDAEIRFSLILLSDTNNQLISLDKRINDNSSAIITLSENVENLERKVDNIEVDNGGFSLPNDYLKHKKLFGSSVTLEDIVGNECSFKVFGGINPITQSGQNLLFLPDTVKQNNGLNINVSNNIIDVSGTAAQTVSYTLQSFILNKGTYSFYAEVEGDVSNTEWNGLHVRIGKKGIVETNGSAVTDNPIISSYGAKTYTVLEDNTSINLMIYCSTSTVINGSATIKVMVNKGDSILPWEEPSIRQNISFNVKSPLTIECGNEDFIIESINDYGLAAIPVTVNADTPSEQSVATYADDKGYSYIADSIEYSNGKLQYIQRIGKKIYSEEDVINEPYLSESSLGLTAGYNVYYVLDEPIVTDVIDTSRQFKPFETITTDNGNAYLYVEYLSVKDYPVSPVSMTRVFSTDLPATYEITSSLLDKELLYIASWEGDITRIDISNIFAPQSNRLQNKNGYVVRELLSHNNFLFAIGRDPVSATAETEGLEYGKGLLMVIDKNTLEVKKNIKLKNKGTGGKIYGDYLYVMEQMWDMAVYSLKVLEDETLQGESIRPIFQLNLDKIAGKSVQWTLGEYQRIDFWYNDLDRKHYAIISAFDKGIHFFDVTNLVTMPEDATSESEQGVFTEDDNWNTFENVRDITRLGGVMSNFGTAAEDFNQVFGVAVKYPYAYLTSAPKDSKYKFGKAIVNGVVTIDISDMSKYKMTIDGEGEESYQWNVFSLFPETTLVDICNIPYDEQSPHIEEGDLHPSRIELLGDVLITNNGEKGIALYRLINGIPHFDKNLSLNGAKAVAFSINESTSIVAVPYQDKDKNKKMLTTLYSVGNINF